MFERPVGVSHRMGSGNSGPWIVDVANESEILNTSVDQPAVVGLESDAKNQQTDDVVVTGSYTVGNSSGSGTTSTSRAVANSLDEISRAVSEPPAGHAASASASAVSSAVSDSPPAGHAVAGSEPAFSLVNLNVDRFVRELESSYHAMSLENLEIAAEHAKSVLSYSQGRGGGYNLRGDP